VTFTGTISIIQKTNPLKPCLQTRIIQRTRTQQHPHRIADASPTIVVALHIPEEKHVHCHLKQARSIAPIVDAGKLIA
jgi:hypothetical protein